jgi:hypothetical protein
VSATDWWETVAPFFKSTPEKQLSTATGARDRLSARLADAENAFAALKAGTEQLAIDGATDNALDTAEAKTRALADRTATLRAALAQSEIQVSNLERERDELADRKQRDETAAEAELLAREVIAAAAAFDVAAGALATVTTRAIPTVYEASGLNNLAAICRTEVPAASDLIAKLLRVHAASVLAGTAPAKMRKPDAPLIVPMVVKPPTVTLFALRPVKFRNANGELIVTQKFQDAELPPDAAKRALELGACVRLSDPLRKAHHGTTPGHPHADLAFDLDSAEPEHKPVEPIMSSASPFTVVDRGPPTQMKVLR